VGRGVDGRSQYWAAGAEKKTTKRGGFGVTPGEPKIRRGGEKVLQGLFNQK